MKVCDLSSKGWTPFSSYNLPVITQVFPDDFHLNTLDQLLSAIARLNPHVNVKVIVIGLMDRLSSYAAREAEAESPEDRKTTEEEASSKLIEKLRISQGPTMAEPESNGAHGKDMDGEQYDGDKPAETPSLDVDGQHEAAVESINPLISNEKQQRSRGVPENVKLYEIFYEQVMNLVNAQRLHIQDTVALLVSLSNLAL